MKTEQQINHQNIWNHLQSDYSIDSFGAALPRYRVLSNTVRAGASALNIGVGHGGLEALLKTRGAEVYCLDPSEIAIAKIREKLQLGNRAKVGFSQTIPFNDNHFDVVIMTEVLEHLDNETFAQTLKEVFRVLKPNGKFIGTVPANENLQDNHAICPHCSTSFHRWGHMQSFSSQRLSDSLTNNGFKLASIKIRCFPDWKRRGFTNFAKSCARYILGIFGAQISGPSIFFIAKKPNT